MTESTGSTRPSLDFGGEFPDALVEAVLLQWRQWRESTDVIKQARALLSLDEVLAHAEHYAHWHYCDKDWCRWADEPTKKDSQP